MRVVSELHAGSTMFAPMSGVLSTRREKHTIASLPLGGDFVGHVLLTARMLLIGTTKKWQAMWSLTNELRLTRAAAAAKTCRLEQARAAALECAVVFAQEAARISREAVRNQDALLAQKAGEIDKN